ncbi:MAG: hypothetical protein U1D06_14510, partial [Paracoccaceae bacterium]|nr:hypothetical protein [Paracoccaceae bacterium]
TAGESAPVPDDELRERLGALLSGEGGRLVPADFWQFVAAVGQGRGIAQDLHSAGIDALAEAPASPAHTREARQRRAYHIGLTARLLLAVGGDPGEASILPTNFSHGAVVSDLMSLLGGRTGLGNGDPQILNTSRRGLGHLRGHARRILVGVVLWRAGRTGKTPTAIWGDLMGDGGEKTKWDRWLREFGCADGEFARDVFAAGGRADASGWFAPFAIDNGKQNMSRAADASWLRLVSVKMGNVTAAYPAGDDVAAVEGWTPPAPVPGTTTELAQLQAALGGRPTPPRAEEKAHDWVGYLVADGLGLDIGPPPPAPARSKEQVAARARVRRLVGGWIASGGLLVVEGQVLKGSGTFKFIHAGTPAMLANTTPGAEDKE